jgi:2-keto-4-pentenoate hydratase
MAGLIPDVGHALVRARHEVCCVTAPSSREGGLTLAEAYAVARAVDAEWSSAGHTANGIKIGFTAQSKWDLLDVTGPFWGTTYSSTTWEAGVEPVDLSRCVAPRLEAEIVVGLARALGPGAGVEEVAHAVAWGALGFEVVDCHVANWKVTAPDLVADFGAHAGLVVGQRSALTPDAALGLSGVAIELTCSGQQPVGGQAEAVLGGPVQAISALLAGPDSPSLPAGSLICTGALTGGAHPLVAGQSWRIDALVGPLASTSVTFAPAGSVR